MKMFDLLIQRVLRGHNPYSGYPASQWWGTWYNDPGASRPIFKAAIDKASPGLIVEVGSFVGESAIHMAKYLKATARDAAILCVDTWYGGIDHWEKVPEKLRFHFGRPSLYYQFIGNVIQHGCQDVIVPLALDSINAARLLTLLRLTPNLVYVDGSHEEGDVIRDYNFYWNLLPGSGVMLVDDLTNWFPGVLNDYNLFIQSHPELNPVIEGEKSMMVKL